MDKVRDAAFRLRLAGHSYNEIQRTLKIPKSTLSDWFKNLVLSGKDYIVSDGDVIEFLHG